jgi:hypothetical protein
MLPRTFDASEERYNAGSKYHRDKYRSYHKAVHERRPRGKLGPSPLIRQESS